MSTKKPAKSPTQKARESAIAEIQTRIQHLDSGDVGPVGDAPAEAVAAAGSPVPPKAGKKAAKESKPAAKAKPAKAGGKPDGKKKEKD